MLLYSQQCVIENKLDKIIASAPVYKVTPALKVCCYHTHQTIIWCMYRQTLIVLSWPSSCRWSSVLTRVVFRKIKPWYVLFTTPVQVYCVSQVSVQASDIFLVVHVMRSPAYSVHFWLGQLCVKRGWSRDWWISNSDSCEHQEIGMFMYGPVLNDCDCGLTSPPILYIKSRIAKKTRIFDLAMKLVEDARCSVTVPLCGKIAILVSVHFLYFFLRCHGNWQLPYGL